MYRDIFAEKSEVSWYSRARGKDAGIVRKVSESSNCLFAGIERFKVNEIIVILGEQKNEAAYQFVKGSYPKS